MKKRIFLLFIGLVCHVMHGSAQKGSPTLVEFISSLQTRYGISFSYDSDLLKNVPFSMDTTNLNLGEVIVQLNERTAFTFEKSSHGNYLLKPKFEGANFKITGRVMDQETAAGISDAFVTDELKLFQKELDGDGNFTVYTKFQEEDILQIRSYGFKPISIPFSELRNKTSLAISMEYDVKAMDEIVVQSYMSSGIQYNRLYNNLEIKPKNMNLLPGQTDADLLISIEALPGINSPDGKAGNINIRGSSPDQTLITFDNIPIYHKGHYFGTLSPFNPKVVEDIGIYRSSFTADKGGRVGGAIDIKTKQNVPDSTMSGLSLSTIDAAAYTHIPLIPKKLSLMVAGRTSLPSSFNSPKLKAISDFIYQQTEINGARDNKNQTEIKQFHYAFNDFNSKLIFQPSANNKVTISFLRIYNSLLVEIQNKGLSILSKDSLTLTNWGLNANWERWWSDRVVSRVSITNSYYTQQSRHGVAYIPAVPGGTDNFSNTAKDVNLTFETEVYGIKKHFWKTGYTLNNHNVNFQKQTDLVQTQPVELKRESIGTIHSAFISYNHVAKKLHSSIGLRGNYFTRTTQINFEPRLTTNYLLTKSITLKSSMGIQKQFITQVLGLNIVSVGGIENNLWTLADGKGIPVISGTQYLIGAMYDKGGWLFDAEGYFKTTNNISVVNINNVKNKDQFYYGSSYALGIDFLVKKRWKKFDAWACYTLSDSKMQFDSIQTKPFESIYNQRHVVDLNVVYKLGQFKMAVGWKYRSGLAALPGIRTKLLHGSNRVGGPPVLPGSNGQATTIYYDRYPSFHQLDFSVVYDFPKRTKQWNGSLGFSIVNVYNQKNIIEQYWTQVQTQTIVQNRYSMGFAPNVFLSINW